MDCHYQLNRTIRSSFTNVSENENVLKSKEGCIKIVFLNFRVETSVHEKNLISKNLHYHLWENRIDPIVQLIFHDAPDILGFCELTYKQLNSLLGRVKNVYQVVGFRSNSKPYSVSDDEEKNISGEIENHKEYVGALIRQEKVSLESRVSFSLPINDNEKEEGFSRVLVKLKVLIGGERKELYVFVSHFHDKGGENGRKKSGEFELNKITEVRQEDKPWVSLGDRNWYPDEGGESLYSDYADKDYICDFRDGNEEKLTHYGPLGTFPGYSDLEDKF